MWGSYLTDSLGKINAAASFIEKQLDEAAGVTAAASATDAEAAADDDDSTHEQ
jgi:hypothetical protein